MFLYEAGLEFSCAFYEGDFSTYVGIEDGVEGEDFGEKGMKLKVNGLHRDVVISSNRGAGLRRQRNNEP